MIHTVHKVSLENGAKGLFIDIPDASVMSFEVNFRAGEYLVQKNKIETPHLMEHMLLGANQKYRKTKTFQAVFEKNGAFCNASTSVFDVNYQAECADFEWDRISELLFLAIDKPLFIRNEFNSELGNVKEEITLRSNNHFRHLSIVMSKEFGLLGTTDEERLERMDNVRLKDIRSHYKKTHLSSNMRFVIGGKLPPERRRYISGILENMSLLKGSGRISLPKEKPVKIDKPIKINNETVKNLYFNLDMYLKRHVTLSEFYALRLFNIIMFETTYSKVFGVARERGILYDLNSGFYKFDGNTNLYLSAQISRDNIMELLDILVKEISKVLSGKITDKDLKSAKQYALGRFELGGQTVQSIVYDYSPTFFLEEKIDSFNSQFQKRTEAVSKEQIVDITKKLFSQNVWGVGCFGNADDELMSKIYNKLSVLWK